MGDKGEAGMTDRTAAELISILGTLRDRANILAGSVADRGYRVPPVLLARALLACDTARRQLEDFEDQLGEFLDDASADGAGGTGGK